MADLVEQLLLAPGIYSSNPTFIEAIIYEVGALFTRRRHKSLVFRKISMQKYVSPKLIPSEI